MPISEASLRAVAAFAEGIPLRLEPLGRGLINDTFLVSTPSSRFVLQRLNGQVFPEPPAVMANLRRLSDEVRRFSATTPDFLWTEIVPTRTGADFHQDEEGGYWRALSFIENTRSLERLENSRQAEQVGHVLGRFHALASAIDADALHDTLPGFHITPDYLARFDRVSARSRSAGHAPELQEALEFVAARRAMAGVLEQAKREGKLELRVIHGDPKLDNVLFDAAGQRAVSLIDLDTVKPGLIHYDLGDCLRSCCNRAGDVAVAGASEPEFDLDFCRAILRGYLTEAGGFLTAADRDYLYDAIRLLPFELGLRFLTDHLEGDVYFKAQWPGQNLARALTQFRLTGSVERQRPALLEMLRDLAVSTTARSS